MAIGLGRVKRRRIPVRLVAVVLWLVVLAVAVGAVLHSQRTARESLEAQFDLGITESAQFARFYVEERFRHQYDQAVKFLSGASPTQEEFELATLSLGYPAAALLDERGRVLHIAPADPAMIGRDLRGYEHVRQALSGRQTVSAVVPSAVTGRPIVAFAVPFDTAAGRRVFSGGFDASASPLAQFLRDAVGLPASEAYLIDSSSAIVATRAGSVLPGQTLRSENRVLADALAQRAAGRLGSGPNSIYFTSTPVVGTTWRMVVTAPTADLYTPTKGGRLPVAWLLVAALALGGLAIVVLVVRMADAARARTATLALLQTSAAQLATARDQAVEAARRLAEAQRMAHLGDWEWDIASHTVTWSEELYRMYGCDPDQCEPSYEHFLDRVHPDDRQMVDETVLRCLETHEPMRYSARILTHQGEVRWIDVRLEMETAADGAPLRMWGTALDITARRTAEEDLAALNADLERQVQERTTEAERANEAKSEFLSRMSHELRTPLNAMLGFAQLLGMDDLAPAQAASVEHIMSGGRHLLGLINEVLDLARIESGHLAMSIEPVALSAVLDEALDLLRPQALVAGVSLPPQSPAGSAVHVLADQQRLRQIVVNLLSNAVKYNAEAGTVSLTCDRRDGGRRLRVAVTDTGPGIAAEEAERIFMPFERLGAADTSIEGTGLGLAVSRRLVEAMGAEMGFTSTPGEGSTFWVDLAVAESPATAAEALPFGEMQAGSEAPEPATVLYIEDNRSNVQLVTALLNRLPQVRLLTANSGHMGLQVARERLPDLVLLDLGLPDVAGGEVLNSLRGDAATASIPVVVVSADATESQVRRLLAAGASAYLTKPLDVELFFTEVDRALQPTPV